ncbi:MAG: hypothetical protein QOG15_2116 [Solirubrobacteraceae bacterium]|nr:hypothetical protein [Solirubrobacteraceae bacterium]
MRALVVTNMYPSAERPALGSFVRDQVHALQRIDGLDVSVDAFSPGGARSYARAARDLRRHHAGETYDIVHAHFGLTAWPALTVAARHRVVTLHGNDLHDPRSRRITSAVLGRMDLVATPSADFASDVPGARSGRRRVAILPCGIDVERFRPLDRRDARRRLDLDPDGRYLLFPYDPSRPVKRVERARELAARSGTELLTLGSVEPADVPYWMNAANAVLCPSDWETFGLACLEALACDVPVLARPVGAHREALAGIAGAYCGEWDSERWLAALAPHLAADDPRIEGRMRALEFSADTMAARVATAWRWLASGGQPPPLYSPAEAPTEPSPGVSSS